MNKALTGTIVAFLLTAAGGLAETGHEPTSGGQHFLVCPHCGYTAAHSAEPAVVGPVAVEARVVEETNQVMAEVAAPVTNNWKMTVYGSFAAKSGNANEKAYKYGGEFDKKADKVYRYKLKLDGEYGKTEEQLTDSNAEASGEMRRMFDERWFSYGTLSALHDDLKDLSYRAKTGPGLGYYFIDTDALIADLSSGPLYVQEKSSGGKSGYLAWRFAQWFDWNLTETFRWWASTEAVMETADLAAYIVAFKTGVDSKISEHLSLIVVIEDDWDSMPEKAGNIKKNDFEISTGLRYHL